MSEQETEVKTEINDNVADTVLTSEEIQQVLVAIQEKNTQYEELTVKHDELTDRLKRLQADFDNFRRRTRQEKEELSAIVNEGLLLQLLPTIDNFERALAVTSVNDVDSLKSGVEMIFKQFMMTLEQMGLSKINAVGTTFDPQWHEAAMRVEDNDQQEGLIVDEFQKGYMVRNKVIRPSMVKVITHI